MKLFALPLLLVALMLPSCSTISNIQRDINQMTAAQYDGLKAKVFAITSITSSRVAKDWSANKRAKALDLIAKGRALLTTDLSSLDATSLIRALADRYSDKMGLDAQAKSDIKDAALLLDVLVGPIKVGVDGKLGERELGLVLALLTGLEDGLNR
jgi:hypothetical protein